MSVDRSDFFSISNSDLDELIQAGTPEGLFLDYKRDTYGNSDSDKREFLKDVSAFANAQGGHIIIGIEEEQGIPRRILGLSDIDQDAEKLRLEQIIRGGLQPRIMGIQTHSVILEGGRFVLIIRIPKSWNPPHRVSANGSNSFWIRNSSGKHEASIEELKNLFTLSSTAIERTRIFRQQRIQSIVNGQGARPLQGNGRLILHIVPLQAFSSPSQIDLELVHQNSAPFRPIGASGYSSRYNFDGFVNYRANEDFGYTQIFRNGILEATKASLIKEREDRRFIPGKGLEEQFFEIFPSYINGLKNIGVQPPLIIMITLEGVQNTGYAVANSFDLGHEPPPLSKADYFLPESVIESYSDNAHYHAAVRPAFDALWNALEFPYDHFFDNNDQWTGRWS